MRTRTNSARNAFLAALVALLAGGCGQDTFYILGPFYDVPDPLPAGQHGDLIKSESVENDQAVDTWRLVFLSQDFQGDNIQSSGVLFVPKGAPPEGGWPLISLAHGTSGLPRTCAPSPLPFADLAWAGGGAFWDVPATYVYPEVANAAGFAVVMADYQGTGVAGPYSYLLGELTGKNVLDAALAAHQLLGDKLSDKTFVWGHSQGGQAAGWASQQVTAYAPGLSLLGTVLVAPAAELSGLVQAVLDELYNVNQSAASALVMTAIPSFALNYGLDPKEILSAAGAATQEGVENVCLGTNLAVFEIASLGGKKASDYLNLPGGQIPADWSAAIDAQDLGQDGAQLGSPALIANGLKDVIVPPEVTCAYFEDAACANGDTVQYNTYANAGHLDVPDKAYDDILQWMENRLASRPAPSNCTNPPAICRRSEAP